MRASVALVALWLAAGLGSAAPPKAPDKVEVGVGEDYILTVEVAADDAFGMAPGFDPADCTFFEGVPRGGKKQFLVRPKKPGRFVVVWWTKGETAYSTTAILAGGTPPTPPTPPGPQPPAPTDPLWPALAVAFRADGAPVSMSKTLAALYRKAAADGADVDSPAFQVRGQLVAFMQSAGQAAVPNPALAATRKVIADDLDKTLGREFDTPLTNALRATYKAQFNRVAELLEALK